MIRHCQTMTILLFWLILYSFVIPARYYVKFFKSYEHFSLRERRHLFPVRCWKKISQYSALIWPLSNELEGSLSFYTFYVTGSQFTWSHLKENPGLLLCMLSEWYSERILTPFHKTCSRNCTVLLCLHVCADYPACIFL